MEIDLVDLVEVAAVAAADSAVDEVLVVHEKCTKLRARTAEKNAKFLSSPAAVRMEILDQFTAEIVTRITRSSSFSV